jgi:ATP-dependent DNA ligase
MNPAYKPMLATLVDEPFDDKKWVFETKWDGFRLITEKRGHSVRLWSRNGVDVTTKYEVLLPALQKAEGRRHTSSTAISVLARRCSRAAWSTSFPPCASRTTNG